MELRHIDARMTQDLDLSSSAVDGIAQIGNTLREKAAIDLGDHFTYEISPPRRELKGPKEGGERYAVEAHLAGRLFVRFPVDLSLGEGAILPPEEHTEPGILAGYGLPPVTYRLICREQQFAEKIHAYTLRRSQESNGRAKDLVDMLLLINSNQLDRERVFLAISKVFALRGTHELPESLPGPPDAWQRIYPDLAEQSGVVQNLGEAFACVQEYLSVRIPSEA